MNVTDVDDKIIRRSIDRQCSSSQIADTYLDSFIEDLRSLNIQMPDALIRVTDKIDSIVRFIQQIERNANAYVNPSTGDVCIKSSELNENKKSSHSNFISPGLADGKQSPEDFVLWKAAKPNEPYWIYSSVTTGQDIRGRPGWHVECSTIANEALGPHVDFHFGGQDLMFPHHFNESACCAAWNRSHDSQSSHEWVSHWIHFGKLIVKNEKMSKSLGNGISVKQHLVTHAPQLLRIACLLNPYKRGYLGVLLCIINDFAFTNFVFVLLLYRYLLWRRFAKEMAANS